METTKKVWKIFGEWAYEQEQAWLNEMADQGWALKKVSCLGMKFEFEACEPGMYTVAALKAEKDDPRIAELIADGAELLTVTEGWHYFRKKKADGELVLFRDIDAHIAYIDKLMTGILSSVGLFVAIMIVTGNGLFALFMLAALLFCHFKLNAKKKQLQAQKKQQESTPAEDKQ